MATASEAEVALTVPQPRPHPSVPLFLSNPSTGRHHDFLFFFFFPGEMGIPSAGPQKCSE